MKSEIEIQKHISSIYFSDGFTDISIGIAMIFFFFILNSSGWIKISLYVGLYIVAASLHFIKRAVAFPRTGVMKPNLGTFKSTKSLLRIMGIGIIICFIGCVYFFFFPLDWEPRHPDLIFDILFIYFPIMLIVTIFAVMGRIFRFFIHITIYTAGFILYFCFDSMNLRVLSKISIILAGVGSIAIGMYMLIQFLRINPIIKDENRNDIIQAR